MLEHDPLCPRELLNTNERRDDICMCVWIRMGRSDEDEKIAVAIEAERDLYERLDFEVQNFDIAARIARNGGRDDRG